MRPSKSQIGAAVFLIIGTLTGVVCVAGALTADIDGNIDLVDRVDPDSMRLTAAPVPPIDGPSTLVLWDPALSPGESLRFDGELGGIFMANLAGHFGPVTTMAVGDYEAGDGARFDGVVYVGVRPGDAGDNPLPEGLLSDVADDRIKTLWLGAGIDQLMAVTTAEGFAARRGWMLAGDDDASPDVVTYKRRDPDRNPQMNRATLVLTDSGGLQEEAPALAKPVLVLRETTERPEAVDSGVARLVGTDPARIIAETSALLDDPFEYASMARGDSPYGDGRAAQRAIAALLDEPVAYFEPSGVRPIVERSSIERRRAAA